MAKPKMSYWGRVDDYFRTMDVFHRIVIGVCFVAIAFLGVLMIGFSNDGVVSEGSEWGGETDFSPPPQESDGGTMGYLLEASSFKDVLTGVGSPAFIEKMMDIMMLLMVVVVAGTILSSIVKVVTRYD